MFDTGSSSSRVRRLLRAAMPSNLAPNLSSSRFFTAPWRPGLRNQMTTKPPGSKLALGLAVALLAALSGLFWVDGPSLASAQSDTTAPTISSIAANAMTLDGATIRDMAGNDAAPLTHSAISSSHILLDAVLHTISPIAITADPGEDDTYAVGDATEVTVTFSEDVDVPLVGRSDMPGDRWPQLELNIGGEATKAEYQSDTGANVIFAYTVQAGDTDDNGIAIGANKLSMNGGKIEDNAGNTPLAGARTSLLDLPHDAAVTHDALSDAVGHKVDGPSSALTLTVDKSPIVNAYRLNPDAELDLDESNFGYAWRRSDGTTYTNIDGANGTGEQFSTYTLTAADVGKTITVRVGFLITESGTLAVLHLISAPTGVVVAGGL